MGTAQNKEGIMGSSWSRFQPQNEIVKLQWAVLEASQLDLTAQELARLLSITGLTGQLENDGGYGSDESEVESET